MKRDLFRRYVWLVDTIRHAKRIQFEEIADLWIKSVLNDDKSHLALRTFHNHRHAVNSLFGIKIMCDRSDRNKYYIADGDSPEATRLKLWMLQKLGYSDLEESITKLADRIMLDTAPEDKFGLNVIIEGMQEDKVVRLVYSIPTSDGKTSLDVAPYCIRYWNSQWFLVGEDTETGIIHPFNLDRVVEITLTDKSFTYPKDFSPRECFRHTFGIELDCMAKPESVRLRIYGDTRDKIRTLPLHASQKEVMTTQDFSVFEYFIVPSDNFYKTVLSHGAETEIISPQSVRDEMARRLSEIAALYSGSAAENEPLAIAQ